MNQSNDILIFNLPKAKPEEIKIEKDEFLYVILPFYNYAKTNRRTQLFLKFLERYKNLPTIRIIIVEATIDEGFQLPNNLIDDSVYMHLKYKLESPIWCKENLINLAVSKLYKMSPYWQYVAWIDADVTFLNQNWVQDTIKKLKKYDFLQLFKNVFYLNQRNETIHAWKSFAYGYSLNREKFFKTRLKGRDDIYKEGLTWSCTRWAFEKIEGLLDINIVGGGDNFFRNLFLNTLESWKMSYRIYNMSENYFNLLSQKQKIFQKNNFTLGYLNDDITHSWHGDRKNRKYVERFAILNGFDPQLDLIRNSDGILNLSERGKRMKNEIMQYFIERKEDF